MPTLIRLFVVLLVLGGLALGGMFGLTVFVKPREKDVTIRIPSRELVASPERAPLVKREINTTRPTTPTPAPAADAASTPAATTPADPAAAAKTDAKTDANGEVVTVDNGAE
jgi:hypothetical protein